MFNKLDNLYNDIGGKIKNWAKWIFIIGAIGSIILGISLMVTASDIDDPLFFIFGILSIIFGPLVAFVSSWLLYAFGQLVEDIHAMRDKEGTTAEVKSKREAEEKSRREAEEKAQREIEEQAALDDPQGFEKKRTWMLEQRKQGINIGTCRMCGSKRKELVSIEFEDFFGKATRNMCYECFCKYNDSTEHK